MNSVETVDLLVIDDLTVRFRQKTVLENFRLTVGKGEVHSLFGDDAAQRSVLLKVVSGEIPIDDGALFFGGKLIRNHSPRKAMRLGIEIVDSSPKYFLNLTVLENIFTERRLKRNHIVADLRSMQARAAEFFEMLSVEMDLFEPLANLHSAHRKLVEIARAVCASPRLLLIDESTIDEIRSILKQEAIEKLYYVFSLLVNGGASILISSSNLDQIFKYADRVSIVRNCSILKTMRLSDTDKIQLVQMTYSSILSRKELEKSNFELFYLKNIYEGIINSMAFPVIVTDTKRNIIMMNRGAERLLKRKKDQSLSQPIHRVLGIEEEAIAKVEKAIEDMSKTQFSFLPGVLPETGAFVFPILDDVESYLGMLLIFSSHDEQIDVGKEIRRNSEMYDSEQRIIKVVHEIKNPLGIILNYLRLLRTEWSRDRIRENVRSIENEVERITRLLDHLQGKHKNADPDRESGCRVSAIINEISELLTPGIEQSGIKLQIRYDYDGVISCDPDRISQVVLNVMLNSIEAMNEGGTLTIACGNQRIEGREYAVMEFQDTGCGIEPENMQKIFDPFFTTKDEDESRGIGLSISLDIVRSLDGFFQVDSEPGRGSTFRVFLPLPARGCE